MARLDRAMDFGPLKIGDRPMFFSRVDGPSQTSLDCVVVFSFHAGRLRGLTGKKSAVFIVGIHTIKWLKSSLLIFLLTYSRNQLRIWIRWQNRKCFYHSTENNWHAPFATLWERDLPIRGVLSPWRKNILRWTGPQGWMNKQRTISCPGSEDTLTKSERQPKMRLMQHTDFDGVSEHHEQTVKTKT